MPDAIINTIIFDFTCGSETAAKGIRNEILHYKAYRINSILSEILSKKMASGSLWKIDRLEIDLGNIRAEDIGTDYMLNQFEVLFSRNIDETTARLRWESVPNISVTSPAEDQMGVVRAVLLTGDLPWWMDKNKFRGLDHIMKTVIDENREELRLFLDNQKNNQDVVRRIGSFYSPGIISLLNSLVPGISSLSAPDLLGAGGKRIYPEMFSSLNFEKEGEQSLKLMMIDRLLRNPGLHLVAAMKLLNVLNKKELADLEVYIAGRHSGETENALQILQKLSVFQLEYLSHPSLFKTRDGQTDHETDAGIKGKMAVSLTDQLESKNPRLTAELLNATGEDLKTLQKIFRKYKKDRSFKKKLIDLIIEHPYFLRYRLLVLLANNSIEPEDDRRSPADLKDKNRRPDSSVILGLKEAQFDLRNVAGRLPKKQIVILNELFSSGGAPSQAAKNIISGLLKRLPDKSLLVISGLTRLNKREIENMVPGQVANSTHSADIRTIVENSGLSLFAPYLPAFFNRLGFTEQGRFKTKSFVYRAAYLLEYIVCGRQRNYEYTMQFNKLLCGLKLEESLPRYKRLTRPERKEAEELIDSIIKNWKALKSTSSKGFRKSFLQRKGILTEQEDAWTLQVERKGYDLLLDSIPWSFNQIKLPWVDKVIRVEW